VAVGVAGWTEGVGVAVYCPRRREHGAIDSPERAIHESPGQRPGEVRRVCRRALKGRSTRYVYDRSALREVRLDRAFSPLESVLAGETQGVALGIGHIFIPRAWRR
jgi:hypothetical protein